MSTTKKSLTLRDLGYIPYEERFPRFSRQEMAALCKRATKCIAFMKESGWGENWIRAYSTLADTADYLDAMHYRLCPPGSDKPALPRCPRIEDVPCD